MCVSVWLSLSADWASILLVVSSTEKIEFPQSPFAPESSLVTGADAGKDGEVVMLAIMLILP